MRGSSWIAGLATIALGVGNLVAADSPSARQLRDTAAACYDVGDYAGARELLGKSLATEDSAEAHLGIVCTVSTSWTRQGV